MPLILLLRVLTGVVSLMVLGAGGYLLWTWIDNVRAAADVSLASREDWRLWAAIALLLWSGLGRFVVLRLLARADGTPSRATRENGRRHRGATGSELYVEMHGPEGAPAILLTHGWGLDSTIWSYAKADLADRFRLILWDLPGLGHSRAAPGEPPSLDGFAADLGTLIANLGRPVVLVGHSIGGMTIQTLLRHHPEAVGRIAGVVLLNTTYTNPLQTMVLRRLLLALRRPVIEPLLHLSRWLQPIVWLLQWQGYLSGSAHMAHRLGFSRHVTRSQLDHSARLASRNPPAVQAQGNLAMFAWNPGGGPLDCGPPLLVLAGADDIVTRPSASLAIAEAGPGRLEVIDEANHMGFLERAGVYNRLIGAFAADAHRRHQRAGPAAR